MKTLIWILILLQASIAGTYRISGHVVVLPTTPVPSTLTLRIYGQGARDGRMNLRPVTVSPDGSFEISGVAPGEYSLSLGAPLSSPGRNFTFRDGDVTEFEVKVATGIPGRIVMVDGSAFSSGSIVLVTTTPVGAININRAAPKTMTSRTSSGPDGSFTLMAFPGENSIRVENLPAGYVVRSITYGAQDLQRDPLKLDSIPTSTVIVTLDRQ